MKFFSEFGSCCGGATVTPASDSPAAPPRQQVAAPRMSAGNSHASSRSSGRSMKVNSSAHWKPALSAILEDRDLGSRKIERTVRSRKKAKSTAIARSPRHGDEYRKDSMMMALPAFSPTAFLF